MMVGAVRRAHGGRGGQSFYAICRFSTHSAGFSTQLNQRKKLGRGLAASSLLATGRLHILPFIYATETALKSVQSFQKFSKVSKFFSLIELRRKTGRMCRKAADCVE